MSKKRKSEHDEEDVKTNTDPSEGETKRARLEMSTVTVLQDLPLELHEHILLEAIVRELRDRKILRSAWKESSGRVVERLRNVCPEWDNLLSAGLFTKRLHAHIDKFPEVDITFSILAWKGGISNCIGAAAMHDDIYLLCNDPLRQQPVKIKVYDRNNLMRRRSTLHLPGVTNPWDIAACGLSNCLYILHQAARDIVVSRVSTEGRVSHFITCSTQLVSKMCVSHSDGKLIIFQGPVPSKITVYNADGSLEREVVLGNNISYLHNIMVTSENNFVLVRKRNMTHTIRTETEGDGEGDLYGAIDKYDRILTVNDRCDVRLLDSEFNSTDVTFRLDSQFPSYLSFYKVSYNKERNEFLAFDTVAFCDADYARQSLTVFGIAERNALK